MQRLKKNIANIKLLRKLLFPILRTMNFAFTIKHHVTYRKFNLLTWEHKGYWYYGRHREAPELLMFEKLLGFGDTVLEVGGHIGYLTQVFEQFVGSNGRVIVVEPTPKSRFFLKKNVMEDTLVLPCAASDTNGEMEFFIEEFGGFSNSLVRDFAESTAEWMSKAQVSKTAPLTSIIVPVRTLDSICDEHGLVPDFLKIDVEGAELSVLQGAEKTLRHVKSLMVEISRNHNEVFQFLSALNYTAFDSNGVRIDENTLAGNQNIFFEKR